MANKNEFFSGEGTVDDQDGAAEPSLADGTFDEAEPGVLEAVTAADAPGGSDTPIKVGGGK